MMQGSTLVPDLTVWQNIVCPLELNGRPSDKTQVTALTTRLRIDNVTDSYPSEISGGEYRRVLLARVLLLDTEILLVDEPTSNLDENSSVIVREILNEYHSRQGKSLIVVTHDKQFLDSSTRLLEIKS